MRNLIAFLLGMVVSYYVLPQPVPEYELSDMDKREIAYEVIEWMDNADWRTIEARRALIKNDKKSWW